MVLAKSHFELREFYAAIKNAERAVALAPDNSIYHEWLGRALGEKADRSGWLSALSLAKKARQEFERAVELDRQNFSAAQALIVFDCAAPGIAGGGEDKARREIEQLASLNAAEGHYAAGNCRRQKKDFAMADAEFDKALSGAKSAELIFDIGDYAAKRGQAERLGVVIDAGQKTAPADARIKFYRAARLIVKNERPEEAESLLREYLKIAPARTGYPSPAAVHAWLGRALEAEGKPDAATREYKTALQLDAKNKIAQDALKKTGKN
jgi:tetratricopeptide (TPR) repeat protein